MMNIIFRNGWDCVWIACDRDGYLAAFVTGGEAPVFSKAVNDELLKFDEVEASILDLPVCSDSKMLVHIPDTGSYMDMAARGFFVYDRADVERTKKECSDLYELTAIPLTPRMVSELPAPLQKLAENAVLTGVSFKENSAINPLTEFI